MDYYNCNDFEEYKDKVLNTPMFSKEDIIVCRNILMKILRTIIHDEGITLREFIEKHDEYMKTLNKPKRECNWRRNNILKALLKKDEITYYLFSFIVVNILKKNINYVIFSFIDKDKNIKEYTIKTPL